MTHPSRQGIDYGPRRGTLGLAFHMAEGGDGTLAYLAKRATETNQQWRTRVRGVSANAVILTDGTVWNMVDWDNASGSMNPADRNPATTGYYNGTVIKAVLGDHFTDPNAYSISVEICGFRKDGPTPAQTAAAIAWGLDMRARFPTIRGAFGHADQTDTKGCPGLTNNMKAIFDGIGGHGLWTPEEEPVGLQFRITGRVEGIVVVKADAPHALIRVDNAALVGAPAGQKREVAAQIVTTAAVPHVPAGTTGYLVGNIPGALPDKSIAAMLLAQDVDFTPSPLADCTKPIEEAVKAAVAADRAKARVVWT